MSDIHIQARLSGGISGMIGAEAGKPAPAEIQWMPPGRHTICASNAEDQSAVNMTILVDGAAADMMDTVLQTLRAKAATHAGDLPFFDFNHDDAEASAHPTRFRWGGDDLKTGGIRAELDWTEPGRVAVEGKAYTRFSPTFTVNGAGVVVGAPVNMGGLVNKAAFRNITPIMAKAADNHTTDMDEEMKKRLAALEADNAKLSRELAEAKAQTTVQAKAGDVLRLETENEKLKEQIDVQAKASKKKDAEAIVAKAVADGRLPGKNTTLQAKWVARIAAEPEAAELLEAMPPSQALRTVIQPGQREEAAGEHQLIVMAKAHQKEHRVNYADAIRAVCQLEPELYQDYNRSLGLGAKR